MAQIPYDRIVELHNLASHAHLAAASAHDKGDHLTGHELSRKAFEHSREAYTKSEQLRHDAGR